ncbi:hypothetical protein DL765_000664 [Monosporascus sp. GIB2]|nr:hypothetical protein DL765_000664 [Monosporascus sp. GIB2]
MPTYITPFRRGRAEGSSPDAPGGGRDGGYQGQQSRGPPVDEAGLYYKRDIANHFFCGEDPHRSGDTRKTLHASCFTQRPNKYTDNPTTPAEEFENKGEQNVPTFPSIQPIRYISSAHPPIAVFEEHWSPWNSARDDSVRFSFDGWYKVARVDLFAPRSAELLCMQQRRWERRDSFGRVLPPRDCAASGGKPPMDMQWAVVKFEKLADDVSPPPAIQKLPEPECHRPSDGEAAPKGFDEMLAELRMGDSSSIKEVGAHADGYEGPRETEVPGKQEAPDGMAPDLGGVQGEGNVSMP